MLDFSTMKFKSEIEKLLRENLTITDLKINDISHKHSSHPTTSGRPETGESHFELMITSPDFETLNPVQRHRKVNAILKPLYDQGLYSVSMKLFSKT